MFLLLQSGWPWLRELLYTISWQRCWKCVAQCQGFPELNTKVESKNIHPSPQVFVFCSRATGSLLGAVICLRAWTNKGVFQLKRFKMMLPFLLFRFSQQEGCGWPVSRHSCSHTSSLGGWFCNLARLWKSACLQVGVPAVPALEDQLHD